MAEQRQYVFNQIDRLAQDVPSASTGSFFSPIPLVGSLVNYAANTDEWLEFVESVKACKETKDECALKSGSGTSTEADNNELQAALKNMASAAEKCLNNPKIQADPEKAKLAQCASKLPEILADRSEANQQITTFQTRKERGEFDTVKSLAGEIYTLPTPIPDKIPDMKILPDWFPGKIPLVGGLLEWIGTAAKTGVKYAGYGVSRVASSTEYNAFKDKVLAYQEATENYLRDPLDSQAEQTRQQALSEMSNAAKSFRQALEQKKGTDPKEYSSMEVRQLRLAKIAEAAAIVSTQQHGNNASDANYTDAVSKFFQVQKTLDEIKSIMNSTYHDSQNFKNFRAAVEAYEDVMLKKILDPSSVTSEAYSAATTKLSNAADKYYQDKLNDEEKNTISQQGFVANNNLTRLDAPSQAKVKITYAFLSNAAQSAPTQQTAVNSNQNALKNFM